MSVYICILLQTVVNITFQYFHLQGQRGCSRGGKMVEAADEGLDLLTKHMIETGGFQEWSCKMDSKLSLTESDATPFLLKFSANGGVSGCGRLDTSHNIRGDVFGNWDSVGVDLKLVLKRKFHRE